MQYDVIPRMGVLQPHCACACHACMRMPGDFAISTSNQAPLHALLQPTRSTCWVAIHRVAGPEVAHLAVCVQWANHYTSAPIHTAVNGQITNNVKFWPICQQFTKSTWSSHFKMFEISHRKLSICHSKQLALQKWKRILDKLPNASRADSKLASSFNFICRRFSSSFWARGLAAKLSYITSINITNYEFRIRQLCLLKPYSHKVSTKIKGNRCHMPIEESYMYSSAMHSM